MAEVPEYHAAAVQVNTQASERDGGLPAPYYLPPPSAWRVLVEMRGIYTSHDPMSGEEFQPLVS